jgi:hypothetical protein
MKVEKKNQQKKKNRILLLCSWLHTRTYHKNLMNFEYIIYLFILLLFIYFPF